MKTSVRLLLSLVVAAMVILVVIYHQSGRRDVRAMEVAVETGLERFYGEFASKISGETNAAAVFQPDDLMRAARQELSEPKFLPSFVKVNKVSVSNVGVTRGTTNLLCVVQPWDDARYGLDASGRARKVSETEFQSWPHSALPAQ